MACRQEDPRAQASPLPPPPVFFLVASPRSKSIRGLQRVSMHLGLSQASAVNSEVRPPCSR